MWRIKWPQLSADIVFQEDELDEILTPPAPVRVQHTDYNVNVTTGSSRHCKRTTYHDAPPSPSKKSTLLHDPVLDDFAGIDLSWLDGPTLEEENSDSDSEDEGDTAMDPGASTEDAAISQV